MNMVIFATFSGNTKKLANAVAKGAGVPAVSVGKAGNLENVDTLFVGASVYADNINGKLRSFLQELKPQQVKKIVLFGSSVREISALSEIKSIMRASGIPVSDNEFHCKGSFLLFHRGHPDANDLKAAEDFARRECGK